MYLLFLRLHLGTSDQIRIKFYKRYKYYIRHWDFFWDCISGYETLSVEFIREFKDQVCWKEISALQELSEDFIEEFKDRVDWAKISGNQELSEDFIRKFKDRVDWFYIRVYQKLSEDFRKEFKVEYNPNVYYFK